MRKRAILPMKGRRLRYVVAVALLVALCSGMRAARGQKRAIATVTNPTGFSRPEEIIEIPLADVQKRLGDGDPHNLQAEDLASHHSLPVQLDGGDHAAPDRLLVLVGIAPHQTIRLAIHEGRQPAVVKRLVFGRVVPERKDDFAWENDKVAYRVYGPALQATGEISSGIDVWSKRVSDLIVNGWYALDAEGQRTHNPALSYHKDAGQGLDSYDVGPTRGCGGTGIWMDGKLFVSKNYVSAEVLAAGPIRFRFRLRYAPWQADGIEVAEQKTVTLDAGSHLNRIESTLLWMGNADGKSMEWAAGVATHKGFNAKSMPQQGILSVWEPLTDPTAGMDGTAIVVEPGATARMSLTGSNALAFLPAIQGMPVVYYAGAAWSKADIPDQAGWNAYLLAFRDRVEHPLKVRLE